MLPCGRVYNEQTLQERFVEKSNLTIRSNMRRWWADSQEVLLEDLDSETLSLQDLQRRRRKNVEKDGQ